MGKSPDLGKVGALVICEDESLKGTLWRIQQQ